MGKDRDYRVSNSIGFIIVKAASAQAARREVELDFGRNNGPFSATLANYDDIRHFLAMGGMVEHEYNPHPEKS